MTLDQHTTNKQHCIWMEAGVVSYKLCDRQFECENCPFDISMRQHQESRDTHATIPMQGDSRPHSETPMCSSAENQIEHLIRSYGDAITGVPYPDDRLYASGHTWVQKVEPHSWFVGLDHMGAAALSDMVSVVLPLPAASLVRHSPFAWIVHGAGTLSLSSPFTGVVLEHNARLVSQPNLITSDPYGAGWMARIQTSPPHTQTRQLRTSAAHSQISRKELGSIQQKFLTRSKTCKIVETTMYDGGRPIQSVAELLGCSAYYEIIRDVFA